MKTTLIALALSALTSSAWTADYSVFRICEDQRVVRTSDGVDAGHVQYIVIEPTSHRIVSTIVSGGAVGERLVPVPIESVTFQGTNEVVLTQITRERLISAPVIERTQLSSTTVIQPTMVERSFTHFGVRVNAETSAVNTSRTDVNIDARQRETRDAARGTAQTREQAERDALRSNNRPNDPNATVGTRRDGERNLSDRNDRRDPSREPRSREERNAQEKRRDGDSNRPANPEAVAERNNDRTQSQRPPNAETNAATSPEEQSKRASGKNNRAGEKSDATSDKSAEKPAEKNRGKSEAGETKSNTPPQPEAKDQSSNRTQERSESKREESKAAGERKAEQGKAANQGEKAEHAKRPQGEGQREGAGKGHQKSDEKERQQ